MQFLICGFTAHTANGGGAVIADGLYRVDGKQKAHGHTRGQAEINAKVQKAGKLKVGGLGNVRQMHHAKTGRKQIACQHTDENGGQLPDAFSEMVKPGDDNQGKDSHQPILPGTIIRRAHTARHVINGCGVEGQADGKNHSAGDQRGKKLAKLTGKEPHHSRHAAAHKLRAQYGRHAVAFRNGLHGGNVGKADAHNDRKPGTDPKLPAAANGKKLQKRGESSDQQRRLDQNHRIARRKPCDVGHDNSRRNAAHDHGHHMLKRQGNRLTEAGDAAPFKNRSVVMRHRDHPFFYAFDR